MKIVGIIALTAMFLLLSSAVAMNRCELITEVAESTGLSMEDATKAVDAVFHAIASSLESGESVKIVGFGTYSVKERGARTGRNPATGETVNVPATKVPVFKAGKALKEAVN